MIMILYDNTSTVNYGGPEGSDITHKEVACKLKKVHANLKGGMQIKMEGCK